MGNDRNMKFIADLHIHSHFSRATSRNLDPEHLCLWAKKKGITVLGTGDFTHPGWVDELQEKLICAENDLYRLKPELERMVEGEIPASCKIPTRFLLSGEISCIYKKDGKTRKVHHLILMPDFESVMKFNNTLSRLGNIRSDGRPILGLDSKDLLEITLEASDRAFLIPAHIWTPWFSLFGSKSGFDRMNECFEDLTPHIRALETGLSSDPPMNRLLSCLDDYLLVSNSDAHSPSKIGREANIFDTELGYNSIIEAMAGKEGFTGTIEFYPEEGKYHLDGHRKCGIRLHPEETITYNGICPACGKALTVGVLHRIAELSDRKRPELFKEFRSLIPLAEILSEIFGCGPNTKKVTAVYDELLGLLGPELDILMDLPLETIESSGIGLLPTALERMRLGQVIRQEGYDGEYGVIRLFHDSEKAELIGQKSLFQVHGERRGRLERKENSSPFKGIDPVVFKKPTSPSETVDRDPILDPLNPAQRSAVLHKGGHLLIVAGPGTGKTMTLTHRIAYIIRSGLVGPGRVIALTFTNKAAREMRRRIDALLSPNQSDSVHTCTFHGFCLEILRKEAGWIGIPGDFTLCPEADAAVFLSEVLSGSEKGKKPTARLVRGFYRCRAASLIGDPDKDDSQEFLPLVRRYHEKLRGMGMLDLDDLQIETLRLFRSQPEICRRYSLCFPKIFVDEYQDTNPLQAAVLKEIITEGANEICAIGDPDQAIYGFRGADVRNFYNFIGDFPGSEKIVLGKNYRSTQVILRAASQVIGEKKPLEGNIGRGGPLLLGQCRTYSEEAEMVVEQIEKILGGTTYFSLDSGRVLSHEDAGNLGFGDIAVLFRLNAQGDSFEEAFYRAGIPFARSGEKPLISRYPANIIWRFFQTLHFPRIGHYRSAYVNLLKDRGNGVQPVENGVFEGGLEDRIDQAVKTHALDISSEESVEVLRRLKDLAAQHKGNMESFLDILSLDRGIDHTALSGDRVALMSLHGAKGLEWPVVFITGCEGSLIPCSLFGDYDESEEKRLLYVGITRAGRRLIMSHAKKRNINGRVLDMHPSPFLELISGDLFGKLERSKWKSKGKSHRQLELFSV